MKLIGIYLLYKNLIYYIRNLKCDKMAKILRIILVAILFVVFFEVGLFSSYTIVTSEAPDVQGLIDMQVNEVSTFFGSNQVSQSLVQASTPINISNENDVALALQNLSNVDGVSVDDMNVTTADSTDNEVINVTIRTVGYESPNSTSSQIVISQTPSYTIIASANATLRNGEFAVDEDSIVVNSILRLFR